LIGSGDVQVEAEYFDVGPVGTRIRSALISDVRPYGSRGRPRAVIGFKAYSAGELDGTFITRSRDVRAIERLKRAGFRIVGPEFLSRTPHPGAAERDPGRDGATLVVKRAARKQ
jgi:hypothetical protein